MAVCHRPPSYNQTMPILKVDIVLRSGEMIQLQAARELADVAGELFGSQPGDTWVSIQAIPDGQYAENGTPDGTYFPVFVRVLRSRWPERFSMAAEAARIAQMAGEVFGRSSDNVHVIYEPPMAGRIAFGGRLTAPLP